LIASSRAEHEFVFIAESNLTEMESVISNERNKGETRLMTPKSSLLVNSWFHLCQLLINSSKLEEASKCIREIRTLATGSQAKIFYLHAFIAERQSDEDTAIKLDVWTQRLNHD